VIPPGAGRRKAARLLREARRRAGLGQTELARRAGVPVRTLTRIECGEVVPRLDTLERLLLACGRTLAVERRICPIETTHDPPLRRNNAHLGNISQGLRYMGSAAILTVIVGRLAARFHGTNDEPLGIEVLVADTRDQRGRLLRVARMLDRRFARVPLLVELTDPDRHHGIWMGSSIAPRFGPYVRLSALDDLVRIEEDPARRARLSALREEIDAG
jgi:transcriptional regulator with XRE-family HTH domain